MFNLFKKNREIAPQPPASSDGAISYSPELINQFISDHKAIFDLYAKIDAAFAEQECKQVATMLKQFKTALQEHLLTENVRLYAYLEQELKDDAVNVEIITDFRKEMNGIAHEAMKFLRKYSELGDDNTLASTFKEDFENIGKVLVERTQREEALLYPLYNQKS